MEFYSILRILLGLLALCNIAIADPSWQCVAYKKNPADCAVYIRQARNNVSIDPDAEASLSKSSDRYAIIVLDEYCTKKGKLVIPRGTNLNMHLPLHGPYDFVLDHFFVKDVTKLYLRFKYADAWWVSGERGTDKHTDCTCQGLSNVADFGEDGKDISLTECWCIFDCQHPQL
jgi:hypothetical protein